MPNETINTEVTNVTPDTIVIKNWWLAQILLEKGYVIKALKKNRYNPTKCVFVFDYSDDLVAAKDEAVRNKIQEREESIQDHPSKPCVRHRKFRRNVNRVTTDDLINKLVSALKAAD